MFCSAFLKRRSPTHAPPYKVLGHRHCGSGEYPLWVTIHQAYAKNFCKAHPKTLTIKRKKRKDLAKLFALHDGDIIKKQE